MVYPLGLGMGAAVFSIITETMRHTHTSIHEVCGRMLFMQTRTRMGIVVDRILVYCMQIPQILR